MVIIKLYMSINIEYRVILNQNETTSDYFNNVGINLKLKV